jgi:hypothetical protein
MNTPRSTPRKNSAWPNHHVEESAECISGLVLQGQIKPHECSGLRREMHAGTSAGRDDGFGRRRVRGVLPLPAAPAESIVKKHSTFNIQRSNLERWFACHQPNVEC